jgi:hypothetical protein
MRINELFKRTVIPLATTLALTSASGCKYAPETNYATPGQEIRQQLSPDKGKVAIVFPLNYVDFIKPREGPSDTNELMQERIEKLKINGDEYSLKIARNISSARTIEQICKNRDVGTYLIPEIIFPEDPSRGRYPRMSRFVSGTTSEGNPRTDVSAIVYCDSNPNLEEIARIGETYPGNPSAFTFDTDRGLKRIDYKK